MRKKIFYHTLSAFLFALCVPVEAQQPQKVSRIGYLSANDPSSDFTRSEAIRQGLRERGYIEGQNIATEYHSAEGKQDRFAELAARLVRLKVDVIVVAGGEPWIRAAKNATKTIPIVMVGRGTDPVKAGLVESLARPGATSPALQNLSWNWAGSGWSCSKKPLPNLTVLRFFTSRPMRALQSRLKRFCQLRRVR